MKVKFVAQAARWFDRYNGNTYHSVRIQRVRDGKVIACGFQYGYGDSYRQTALEAMRQAKWLPRKYGKDNVYAYERENDYPISWHVTDGLKRDCIKNGTL